MLMVDPPSGWQYGFPKPAPTEKVDMLKWLVDNGYPQKLIDQGMGKYVRYYEHEED